MTRLVATQTRGTCMGAYMECATLTIDLDATPRSGDLVVVLYRQQSVDPDSVGDPGGTRLIGGAIESRVKQLEATRDGKWWLTCHEGVIPIDCNSVPAALFRVIDVQPDPFGTRDTEPVTVFNPITPEALAGWDEHSRAARIEWTLQGKLRNREFPGIENVLKTWPASFHLPPGFLFNGVRVHE